MNKNRLFYCMITCLCSAALMTSCAPKATDNTAAPTEANTTAAVEGNTALVTPAMIYEARTPYLGDAVAAGRLTGLLKRYYGIEENHTTELQTKYQPYGLTLHFEEEADNAAMQKMAAALISLIDNCSSVSWDYPADAEGNHARFYLSYEALPQTLDEVAGHIKEYADSEAGFQTLLDQLETVREHLPAVKREKTVERAVAAAILEYRTGAFSDFELSGEGHMILDTKMSENGSGVTVYALTSYGGYQFQNGNFVKSGGTGVVPAVISLVKEPDGQYQITHFQPPLDGGDWLPSIHELFPEALWDQCASSSAEDYETLKKQEQVYAADYLKAIGREGAAIGDYSEFPYVLLSDAGIPVETANRLSDRTRVPGEPAAYAPYFLGTIERIEDGVRYVYQTSCDPENKEVIYSKFVYETGLIVEQIIYDSDSGEVKSSSAPA